MNNIRTLRRKQGMTQQEIADKLSVKQSTIAMWETGKATPRSDKLPELARILGCTIDELFAEAG